MPAAPLDVEVLLLAAAPRALALLPALLVLAGRVGVLGVLALLVALGEELRSVLLAAGTEASAIGVGVEACASSPGSLAQEGSSSTPFPQADKSASTERGRNKRGTRRVMGSTPHNLP